MVLSLVSLFTDMASEMLYPVMPVFLESIGFSVLLIGILEGCAEMIAGLSKGYFGQVSDIRGRRLPFVQWGYLLSAISKPMMAVFMYPLWIFFARTTDRIGKGLRTGPRDAMLSAYTTAKYKARVFGFHRSMDTLGAVAGPLIALLFLTLYPNQYRSLFLLALIPGLLAVACTFFLKDTPVAPKNTRVELFGFLRYFREGNSDYKKLLSGLLLFAIINSSDVLLLLKMKQSGVEDSTIILVYVFYNAIYALAAFPAGIFADRIGIKYTLIAGLILFTCVYAGFALTSNITTYWILFAVYGIYAACVEGVAKAWIANITPHATTATAIGTYAGLSSIAAFFASALAGGLWTLFGAPSAFGTSAVIALVSALLLLRVPYRPVREMQE